MIYTTPLLTLYLQRLYTDKQIRMPIVIDLSHMPLCISMISGVCVQGMWNAQVKGQVTEHTLEWCQLNALQASPVVHLVTPLSCVSLSMNTQPSVPAIETHSIIRFTS